MLIRLLEGAGIFISGIITGAFVILLSQQDISVLPWYICLFVAGLAVGIVVLFIGIFMKDKS